ncbi:hypothetical protein SsS58_00329 [Streptomyces scabiei]|uniref:Uncharacterized protein n=1 Tax=Streptomyces scabiei TaxID=1930 RepID=A0A117EC47_STRSC|nr:hypothetical protein SsS58_00329 [Streptomyces scabiei]
MRDLLVMREVVDDTAAGALRVIDDFDRLAWLAAQLGYSLTKPGGRRRATLAVAFWRIAHSYDEPAHDG